MLAFTLGNIFASGTLTAAVRLPEGILYAGAICTLISINMYTQWNERVSA